MLVVFGVDILVGKVVVIRKVFIVEWVLKNLEVFYG